MSVYVCMCVCVRVFEGNINVSVFLLEDNFLLELHKSILKLLQMQNRSCTVASGMKTVGHVLQAHGISAAKDRLLNIMDDQRESLASIYDFQNTEDRSM
ncbi:hypothetical protein EYF80_006531 [Scomber scombrus]|uniref:Uncharacterized protein n=1 Tax=Scomber scombrus TaxID=13677 RepID=A0AAV1N8V5_SCOSC